MVTERPIRCYLKIWVSFVENVNVVTQITPEKLAVVFTVFVVVWVNGCCGNIAAKINARLTLKCRKRLGMKIGTRLPAVTVNPNAVNSVFFAKLAKLRDEKLVCVFSVRACCTDRIPAVCGHHRLLGMLRTVFHVVNARVVHIQRNVLFTGNTPPKLKRVLFKVRHCVAEC